MKTQAAAGTVKFQELAALSKLGKTDDDIETFTGKIHTSVNDSCVRICIFCVSIRSACSSVVIV